MSNAKLKQDLANLRVDIETQIRIIVNHANSQGIEPLQMQTMHGDYILAPLLVAKSNVLLALSNLEKS